MNETQIKNIADTLLPQFIPKSEKETSLSFHFTVPPNNTFRVWYDKVGKSWNFVRFERIVI